MGPSAWKVAAQMLVHRAIIGKRPVPLARATPVATPERLA